MSTTGAPKSGLSAVRRAGEKLQRVVPVAADATLATTDSRGRELRDIRISITDRCNFRCVYCMPKEVFGRDYMFLPKEQLLRFEEITRIARIGIRHGVRKVRLTGGEPLLRKGLEDLVGMLAELKTIDGDGLDIALTTNGSALRYMAPRLKAAGLNRVTVSLDSMNDDVFKSMNDVDFPVARVLDGIDAALEAGFTQVKVNTVAKRSMNDADLIGIAEHFKGTGVTVRFIEFMDVGSTNGWELDEVIPSREIVERIGALHEIEPVEAEYIGEVASRYRYRDGGGEFGVISSVTNPFCGTCTRARISADGKLFTCLFADHGHDLRGLMRGGCSDEELEQRIGGLWAVRDDHYSEIRSTLTPGLRKKSSKDRIEMSYIGG